MNKTRFDGRVRDGKEEWLTPPKMVEALGPFDLDPCSALNMPWVLARDAYTKEQDGLAHEWWGRVWLNPPYGNKTDRWLREMARHNNGIALIFARTDTDLFFDQAWGVWKVATALYFIKRRVRFYQEDGTLGDNSGGAPSVLIAYGEDNAECLRHAPLKEAGWDGRFIKL